jgi:hypothetical protein
MPPFHLRYRLSRSQRLGVLLAMEGIGYTLFGPLLFAFFCFAIVANARQGKIGGAFFFAAMALGVFLLWRTVVLRLLSILLFKSLNVDLLVRDNGAGILIGRQRWYFFLDGITSIKPYRPDLWTIRHFSGLILHIPTSIITTEQLQHFRDEMQRGHTPEGMRMVIERGKRVQELMKEGK